MTPTPPPPRTPGEIAAEIAGRHAPHAPAGVTRPGLAIALSGGGFRAMLFHLGALRRLNELGFLSAMDRMSTVSGGSIAGAVLALHWRDLGFEGGVATRFDEVERSVFAIADRSLDVRAGIAALLPGVTGAAVVARALRGPLRSASLADVPGSGPRFTFNTTNMQTGDLFRWSSPYAADYKVGRIIEPRIGLAEVVAASAAFPPVLSPLRIRVPGTLVGFDEDRTPIADPPDRLWLTDGGVYDNLGLQTVSKLHTVLVSDGGAPFAATRKLRPGLPSQMSRTTFLLDEQVRRLRRGHLVDDFEAGRRRGALWTIQTPIHRYGLADSLPCPEDAVRRLAAVRTRLKKVPADLKLRLANWGYASADAAVRAHVDPNLPPPKGFPHPGGI